MFEKLTNLQFQSIFNMISLVEREKGRFAFLMKALLSKQGSFITARKTIFSFSKCSEKMIFPKKLHWNMIFLVSSGKMIFLFPENMILFFRRKMKDDLSQKKYMEKWCILQMFWKDGLSKTIALEYHFSYILWKDGISFSRKYDIFCTDGKRKMIFLKKYMEIWCFLFVGKGVISFSYKYEIALLSKKQRWSFPEKYT